VDGVRRVIGGRPSCDGGKVERKYEGHLNTATTLGQPHDRADLSSCSSDVRASWRAFEGARSTANAYDQALAQR
jgi:hypothetical protein